MREYDFETYRVFTDLKSKFYGNTSSVVLLPGTVEERRMQQIAADFWQPATTFLWKENENWRVRWFAPDAEINLCGHGSLAAVAFICDNFDNQESIVLNTTAGHVYGGKYNDCKCYIELDAIEVLEEVAIDDYLKHGLGVPILGHYRTNNKHIVLVDSEESVRIMKPDFSMLRTSDIFGYAVTAPGSEVDFVSRTIVPHVHQLEDPATGSSHAALLPFWRDRLNKTSFRSQQLSKRGGMFCGEVKDNRVRLFGAYQKINRGTICSF